jgi:hypothetical protein
MIIVAMKNTPEAFGVKDWQSFWDWDIFFPTNSLNKAKKRKNLFFSFVTCDG